MHQMKIVHRDVKPDNCIFSAEPNPELPLPPLKICDFGLARLMPSGEEERMFTVCGTPGYAAPETLSKNGYKGGSSDMWSVGESLFSPQDKRCEWCFEGFEGVMRRSV